jgi:hypothetical protein
MDETVMEIPPIRVKASDAVKTRGTSEQQQLYTE